MFLSNINRKWTQMDANDRSLNAIIAPIGESKAGTASICVHLRLIFLDLLIARRHWWRNRVLFGTGCSVHSQPDAAPTVDAVDQGRTGFFKPDPFSGIWKKLRLSGAVPIFIQGGSAAGSGSSAPSVSMPPRTRRVLCPNKFFSSEVCPGCNPGPRAPSSTHDTVHHRPQWGWIRIQHCGVRQQWCAANHAWI
jgi:hypothetical protein